jgi:hypothetical protein
LTAEDAPYLLPKISYAMLGTMNQTGEDWPRLGRYVVSARIDAGYREQRDLAAATGITSRTIGKLERGRRVGTDTLTKVAKAVGWTPDSPLAVLAGGEPRLTPCREEPPAGGLPVQPSPLAGDAPDLAADVRRAVLAAHVRTGTAAQDLRGGEIFGGRGDAAIGEADIWDRYAFLDKDETGRVAGVERRIRAIAAIRAVVLDADNRESGLMRAG